MSSVVVLAVVVVVLILVAASGMFFAVFSQHISADIRKLFVSQNFSMAQNNDRSQLPP